MTVAYVKRPELQREQFVKPQILPIENVEQFLRTLEQAGPETLFDLHIHTTISDGSDGFYEVITQALEKRLAVIAFTNHDTTVGLDYAVDLASLSGLQTIGGIEISAWSEETQRKVHILGYGLHSESPAIRKLCQPLLEKRKENTLWQLEKLLEEGYKINRSLFSELSQTSTAGYKQHLMAALTDDPYGSYAYKKLYQSLFKGNGMCARDITYVDACEAVEAIKQDGGVAVLAHPGQLDSYDLVPDLVASGLRGIEKFHPDHTSEDWKRCDKLAQQFDLVRTGGSDYHGIFGSSPALGVKR